MGPTNSRGPRCLLFRLPGGGPERLLPGGGAGGGDAPATGPGRWPGSAPLQTGAGSVLSSCLNFLALYCWMHCSSGSAASFIGAALPLYVVAPVRVGYTTTCCTSLAVAVSFAALRGLFRNVPWLPSSRTPSLMCDRGAIPLSRIITRSFSSPAGCAPSPVVTLVVFSAPCPQALSTPQPDLATAHMRR